MGNIDSFIYRFQIMWANGDQQYKNAYSKKGKNSRKENKSNWIAFESV